MNGKELLNGVDMLHREKNISREIIFDGIEKAVRLAIHKCYDDEEGVVVTIDRDTGEIHAQKGEESLDAGRARPHRRPGRQAGHDPEDPRGGVQRRLRRIRRHEGRPGARHRRSASRAARPPSRSARPRRSCRAANRSPAKRTTSASASRPSSSTCARSAIASRSSCRGPIPTSCAGCSRTKSPRSHDRTIEIKAVAREAGYRTKIAVSSIDMKVDCVGACVGVRGSRIKNIVDELGGERIDIVRWNDSLQVLIPNALQPAADRGGVPLSAPGPGHRAGQGRSAVAGHRPARPERPAGQQAGRLGHRDHDARRAERGHRAGRGLVPRDPGRHRRRWSRRSSRKASCRTTT